MIPKPDLLVECAQGFVEGWTADSVRAYAAEQVAAERERCAGIARGFLWYEADSCSPEESNERIAALIEQGH